MIKYDVAEIRESRGFSYETGWGYLLIRERDFDGAFPEEEIQALGGVLDDFLMSYILPDNDMCPAGFRLIPVEFSMMYNTDVDGCPLRDHNEVLAYIEAQIEGVEEVEDE